MALQGEKKGAKKKAHDVLTGGCGVVQGVKKGAKKKAEERYIVREGAKRHDPKTIHIFSLASGHLYERLQKIMMVSLLSHTKQKIKFWFLENFASPHYKDFMPIMAKQ